MIAMHANPPDPTAHAGQFVDGARSQKKSDSIKMIGHPTQDERSLQI